MAMGFEGSKGVLHNQPKKEEEEMALGIEGSKGILVEEAKECASKGIRSDFQQLTWRATRGELGFDEFISQVRSLPARMSVSAFANGTCSLACPHCYLRGRARFDGPLPEPHLIAQIANNLAAADFSIVGMEPLEDWDRTRKILELAEAKRKAVITNGVNLTEEIARDLGKKASSPISASTVPRRITK